MPVSDSHKTAPQTVDGSFGGRQGSFVASWRTWRSRPGRHRALRHPHGGREGLGPAHRNPGKLLGISAKPAKDAHLFRQRGPACLASFGANSATSAHSSLEIAPVTACMSRPSFSMTVRSAIGFAASTDCAPSPVAAVAKAIDKAIVKNSRGSADVRLTRFSIEVVDECFAGERMVSGALQNSRLSAIDPKAWWPICWSNSRVLQTRMTASRTPCPATIHWLLMPMAA